MKRQDIYCNDILARIDMIRVFTADGRAAFLESPLIQEAVIRCFEVIGEAVKRLDDALIAEHPAVPWSDFTGFRNFLIHQYDKVNFELVWDVIEVDLPPLEAAIRQILTRLTHS